MNEREEWPSEEEILDAKALITEHLRLEDMRRIYNDALAHLNAKHGAGSYTEDELHQALGERVLDTLKGPGS
jgi:hypothetical protein